jgi:geranylgeranyl diphosphate synthase type I
MYLPLILDDARQNVTPALKEAIAELSPEINAIVAYHMGWRDHAGNPVTKPGSKSVRPALALLAAQAAGANPSVAIPGAVAVELLNNWAFLLDDVMDGDRFRRQRETAWVVFGQGQAICAGSALLTLAVQCLLQDFNMQKLAAVRLITGTASQMLGGQTLDLTFEDRLDVSITESMTMTKAKTASLMRCAMMVGAILAKGSENVTSTLGDFGHFVGMAFQARDDMLGIWGRPEQTGGRPPGFDLRARKCTPPIAFALASSTPAAKELHDLLDNGELTEETTRLAAGLVKASGGWDWTADLARRMVAESLASLDRLDLESQVREDLISVARLGLPSDIDR